MLKFTFAVQKMKVADMSRAEGHNCRLHATASQLPARAWITKAGHHTIAAWDADKASEAKALAKRKDAVVGIEIVMQVGNQLDWREPPTEKHPEGKPRAKRPADLNALAKAGKAWLEAEFGADNVVSIEIHTDESTPHLQAVVVPRKGGKLQAKAWMDGPAKLAQLRERAYKAVNRLIPCDYEKGAPGGKPHDQGKAAGQAPAPGMLDKLIGWKPLKDENAQLRARVAQLEQALFSRRKAAFKATEQAAAEKRAAEAEAEANKAKQELEQAQKRVSELQAVRDLFTDNEVEQALERMQRLTEAEQQRRRDLEAADSIRAEQQRRVDDLPRVEKQEGGAAHTFARMARAAIATAGDVWQRVDWPTVEQRALHESVTRHRQDPEQAITAVLRTSPGCADEKRQMTRESELKRIATSLRPVKGARNDHDYGGPRP